MSNRTNTTSTARRTYFFAALRAASFFAVAPVGAFFFVAFVLFLALVAFAALLGFAAFVAFAVFFVDCFCVFLTAGFKALARASGGVPGIRLLASVFCCAANSSWFR